jgi:type I restriction enzyme M protein
VLVIAKQKPHKGQILLINASKTFSKGRPKNFIPESELENIANLYHNWQSVEGISTTIGNDDAEKYDFNLSPSRFVSQSTTDDVLPLEEAVARLRQAETERQEADKALNAVLKSLGL